MADQKAPTPGEIAIMGGGAVALVGSFLNLGEGFSSWSGFVFPVFALVGIFGGIMAAQVALTKYANVSLPDKVGGMTWPQINFVLAFYGSVLTVSELINETSGKKIGFWFLLIGSIAALVGTVMLSKERGATSPMA